MSFAFPFSDTSIDLFNDQDARPDHWNCDEAKDHDYSRDPLSIILRHGD